MTVTTTADAGPKGALAPSKIRRLHHHAFPIIDQEANRQFMEDLIGIPLRATWTEVGERKEGDDPNEPVAELCHTFYELADGGAMAFFQMAKPYDKKFLVGTTNVLDHIALETDPDTQEEIHQRLLAAGIAHYITEHGYVRSMYVTSPDGLIVEICADPPDVDEIKERRAADAHSELKRWLGGDHETNNYLRHRSNGTVRFEGRSLYDPERYGKD